MNCKKNGCTACESSVVKKHERSENCVSALTGPIVLRRLVSRSSIASHRGPKCVEATHTRWPKLNHSFSIRAIKPSILRKYGSSIRITRELNCKLRSHLIRIVWYRKKGRMSIVSQTRAGRSVTRQTRDRYTPFTANDHCRVTLDLHLFADLDGTFQELLRVVQPVCVVDLQESVERLVF